MTVARTRDYELGEPIESGNRTITYRAQWSLPGPEGADSPLQRAVLVKTVKSGIRATAELTAALGREAARLSELDHPLWPTLLDYVADEGQVALVFPDHGGVRLDKALAKVVRIDPLCAMAIGIEAARALGAIHRRGWVHFTIIGAIGDPPPDLKGRFIPSE